MTFLAAVTDLLHRARAGVLQIDEAAIPNGCVFCGEWLHRDAVPMCNGCRADLPWIEHSCLRCGSPLPVAPPDGISCGRCQLEPTPFEAVVVPLHYRFPVDAAIKAFKFRRALHYGPAFASILAVAARRLPAGVDGVLPVPLHWRRQALRGFNQAAELCAPLQHVLNAPLVAGARRVRATGPQSGLGAVARRRNLHDAFVVSRQVEARHVLIVDDVVTTGATCAELAGALRRAGVGCVSVLALARAATPN